ncbi:MAG: fumarylacetoacetate hydrolase family protein [Candidatus Bathyarchaeota archaeon]|nr:MAG: fumarylacetoacetate hydrolase family protein [Candidatus Bathyarchaeota archaeon]
MRLVTFREGRELKVGALIDGAVLDLRGAFDHLSKEVQPMMDHAFNDMKIILKHFPEAMPVMQELISSVEGDSNLERKFLKQREEVQLTAPIPRPSKTMITGPSWRQYIRDGRVPDFIFILKPPTAIIGPGDDIVFPRDQEEIVTEVELAIVVGKPGRYIGEEEAWDHIAGFTVFNDVTDYGLYTRRTPSAMIRAKSYDTFAAMGPCITTREQIGDVHDLELVLRLNGEERVRVNTSEMIYPITHFVASVSEVMTLRVGDVISTGCPQVVPVQPGDSVEAEIENIGVLRNQFVNWKEI